MLVSAYVPALSYIACILIGFGMTVCMLAPLYGVPIMKAYPSRSVASAIIGLAITAVLIHAVIAEMFLGAPTSLYIFYAVIMGVLVFVYMQVEPFLMFTLRKRITDEDIPAKSDGGSEAPAQKAQTAKPVDSIHEGVVSEDPLKVLSRREREVVELICLGHSNADIAKMLFISEHTVKDHTKKIYPKMGVHSRFELATLVNRLKADREETTGL